MELSTKQIRYLRGLAHHLNPVVQIGKNGYTDAIVKDVLRNLQVHELIKVRISADERTEFLEMSQALATETESALVQKIGRIVVLYKPGTKPEIKLP